LSDSRREAVNFTPRSLPAYHFVSEGEAYSPEMRWERGTARVVVVVVVMVVVVVVVEGALPPPPPPLPTAARAAAWADAESVDMTSPLSVRRGGNRMDGTRAAACEAVDAAWCGTCGAAAAAATAATGAGSAAAATGAAACGIGVPSRAVCDVLYYVSGA